MEKQYPLGKHPNSLANLSSKTGFGNRPQDINRKGRPKKKTLKPAIIIDEIKEHGLLIDASFVEIQADGDVLVFPKGNLELTDKLAMVRLKMEKLNPEWHIASDAIKTEHVLLKEDEMPSKYRRWCNMRNKTMLSKLAKTMPKYIAEKYIIRFLAAMAKGDRAVKKLIKQAEEENAKTIDM